MKQNLAVIMVLLASTSVSAITHRSEESIRKLSTQGLMQEQAEEMKIDSECKEEKKEAPAPLAIEKQAADPLPNPVPAKKNKPAPMPLVGTANKVTDKSDPEFYEPMPIRSTSKPLTSYVNGKPFKDGKCKKASQKDVEDPVVEVPHDKEPFDWRDPEAAKVYDDLEKRSKMNAFEKRVKKKEEKAQKDWEEKQAELRGVTKEITVEESATDKKKDKFSFEKVKMEKSGKKAAEGGEVASGKEGTKGKGTDGAKSKDADGAKPKEVDASKPQEVDAAKPKEVDAAKPKEVDASKPKETDTSKPKEADASKPKEAESAKSKESEVTKGKETTKEGSKEIDKDGKNKSEDLPCCDDKEDSKKPEKPAPAKK